MSSSVPDPGSGCLFDPWIRNGRKSASGIRDEQPGSYFLELRNNFFGLKSLNSLMRIRDPGWRQFGSGMEKSRIRDKHPGSAIPAPSCRGSVEVSPSCLLVYLSSRRDIYNSFFSLFLFPSSLSPKERYEHRRNDINVNTAMR